MTPTDRAALAARLRDRADAVRPYYADEARDLEAAAAELERPRPRLSWHVYWDGMIVAQHGLLVGDLTLPALSVSWLALRWADLVAAGFDVDPLPEVPYG